MLRQRKQSRTDKNGEKVASVLPEDVTWMN